MSKAKIDPTKCQGCGQCAYACPVKAIHKNAVGVAEVNPELCTGCELCTKECPLNAIGIDNSEETK